MFQLRSPEFVYKNDESVEQLVALIYNAIYSLSRINTSEWTAFLVLFKQAKLIALTRAKTPPEKTKNHESAIASLLVTFEKYNDFLKSADEQLSHAVRKQDKAFIITG